jgi:hypothetical protein
MLMAFTWDGGITSHCYSHTEFNSYSLVHFYSDRYICVLDGIEEKQKVMYSTFAA